LIWRGTVRIARYPSSIKMKPLINSANVSRSNTCAIVFETPIASKSKPIKKIIEPK